MGVAPGAWLIARSVTADGGGAGGGTAAASDVVALLGAFIGESLSASQAAAFRDLDPALPREGSPLFIDGRRRDADGAPSVSLAQATFFLLDAAGLRAALGLSSRPADKTPERMWAALLGGDALAGGGFEPRAAQKTIQTSKNGLYQRGCVGTPRCFADFVERVLQPLSAELANRVWERWVLLGDVPRAVSLSLVYVRPEVIERAKGESVLEIRSVKWTHSLKEGEAEALRRLGKEHGLEAEFARDLCKAAADALERELGEKDIAGGGMAAYTPASHQVIAGMLFNAAAWEDSVASNDSQAFMNACGQGFENARAFFFDETRAPFPLASAFELKVSRFIAAPHRAAVEGGGGGGGGGGHSLPAFPVRHAALAAAKAQPRATTDVIVLDD